MRNDSQTSQPNLFDSEAGGTEIEKILLYALGEFQERGKVLADRELALDRLRGALKRAAEKFNLEEFSDEEIARALEKCGSKVVRVPNFVAKHPFRVTIQRDMAEKAKQIYRESLKND